MQELYKSGRYFFAFAIIAFGIIQFNANAFMAGFLPMPPELPAHQFFLYFISTLFVVGGICMCIINLRHRAALLIGLLLLAIVIYPHLVSLLKDIHNPGPWTAGGEALALCGGAFIIAGEKENVSKMISSTSLIRIGKILFAVSLMVFCVQHIMYADYVSTLIPSWIPAPLFLTYFIGAAFAAGGISILTSIQTRLACILLGFMFLFWVIFLHLPRVAADTHKETEKTSMFIAFAFCGIFFTIASQYGPKTAAAKK